MDDLLIAEVKTKMQKAIQVLQDDLATVRTGRASPALIENVPITAYEGTQNLKVKEMATITTEGPRALIIAPFDPTVVKDIEKGINSANLGLNAVVDGQLIRINIPALTSDRRDEFIKLANSKLENGRVMLRQIRHDILSSIKRNFEAKEIFEDDKKKLEKEMQTLTDEMMAEIEVLREKKEQELRQI